MILVTGGCSFSECESPWIDTWPKHLARALPDYTHISTAMGCQGNGLISRRIIHQVIEQLKHTDAKDLLVGIMWSGADRHDFFTRTRINSSIQDGWQENPIKFVEDATGAWVICNWNWSLPQSKQYYTTFWDSIGQCVYTCEHVLRTQWFLKSHNIRYFMSTYTGEVFNQSFVKNKNVIYLYDQIDFTQFLPVAGEYEWCKDFSNLEFPVKDDKHPDSKQHKLFTEQVILPFLKSKNYV